MMLSPSAMRGMGAYGVNFDTQLQKVAKFQATGNITDLGVVDPVRYASLVAGTDAATNAAIAARQAAAWQNSPSVGVVSMQPMTLGQKLAALPAATKLGIGLGAAALVGLVLLRRSAS